MTNVTDITRRGALSLAAALGLATAVPTLLAGSATIAPPAAVTGEDTEYTEEWARDFAMIWLAGGISAARMRQLADETGDRQNIMRADAAEQLEAEGFDAKAYLEVIRAELAAEDAARPAVTALPASPGEREQAIQAVARDFLSRGVTPADVAPLRDLSPFAEIGDAMTGLTGGAR